MERITGGWAVEFGYCLDGAAVQVYEEGCAARFLVQNGQIAEITLQARSYEETAESGLVLPRLQAMAAMEAAGLEGRGAAAGISGQRRRNGHRPAGSPGERDRRGGRAVAWPKIKNIIILMLLVTNLCLLAFVGWREIRDWAAPGQGAGAGRLLPGGAGHPGGRAHRAQVCGAAAHGHGTGPGGRADPGSSAAGGWPDPGGTQRRGLCL